MEKLSKGDLAYVGNLTEEQFDRFLNLERSRLGLDAKKMASSAERQLRGYAAQYKALFFDYKKHMRGNLSHLKVENYRELNDLLKNNYPGVKNVWTHLLNPNVNDIPLLEEAIRILSKEMLIREVPKRGGGRTVYLKN